MENFIDKLNIRLNKLKADGFKVIDSSIRKPDSLKEVNSVFKKLNVPPIISAFCEQVGGYTITIENRILKDKPIVSNQKFFGLYSFRQLEKVLKPKKELGISEFSPEEFFILEYLTYGNMVLLSTKPNQSGLFLYTYHKHLNKLNLQIDNYFEKMVEHLGEDLWQQNYIDDPSKISSFYLTEKKLVNASKIDYKLLIEENRNKLKIKNKPKYQVGASANLLMKCQETLGVKFPDEILCFYSQTNGMELDWTKQQFGGSINLMPLDKAISGKEASVYDYDKWTKTDNHKENIGYIDAEDEAYELSQKLCILENFVGDSGLVGFLVSNQNQIELYYRLSRGNITKLNMSWVDYLNIHLELLGYWCWIQVKEEGIDGIGKDSSEYQSLTELFPEFDFNRLKK